MTAEQTVARKRPLLWISLLLIGFSAVALGVGFVFGAASNIEGASLPTPTPTATPNLTLLPTDNFRVMLYWAHRVQCPEDAPKFPDGTGPNICLDIADLAVLNLRPTPVPGTPTASPTVVPTP